MQSDIHQVFVIDHVFSVREIQHMITLWHWLNCIQHKY